MDNVFQNDNMDNPILAEPTNEPPTNEPTEPPTNEPTDPPVNEPPVNEPPQQPTFNVENYLSQIANKLTNLENNIQPKEQPPTDPPPDPEKLNSEFMDKFYENPIETIKQLQEQAVKPYTDYIENLKAQQHWSGVAKQFADAHPDFNEHKENMKKILMENPTLQQAKNPYEMAYQISKGQQPKNINEILNSDNSLETIMNNEELVNKIVQNYMSKKETPPKVIANDQGSPVLTDKETPKSINQGTKAWLSSMGIG